MARYESETSVKPFYIQSIRQLKMNAVGRA